MVEDKAIVASKTYRRYQSCQHQFDRTTTKFGAQRAAHLILPDEPEGIAQ